MRRLLGIDLDKDAGDGKTAARDHGFGRWGLKWRVFSAQELTLRGRLHLTDNLRIFAKRARLKAPFDGDRAVDMGPAASEKRHVVPGVRRWGGVSVANAVRNAAAIGRRTLPSTGLNGPLIRRGRPHSFKHPHSGSSILGNRYRERIGQPSAVQSAGTDARARAGVGLPTLGILTGGAGNVPRQKLGIWTFVEDRAEHPLRGSGGYKAAFAGQAAPYEPIRERVTHARWRSDSTGARRNPWSTTAFEKNSTDQGVTTKALSLRRSVGMTRTVSKLHWLSEQNSHFRRIAPTNRAMLSNVTKAHKQGRPDVDPANVLAPQPSQRVRHVGDSKYRSTGGRFLGASFRHRQGIGQTTEPSLRPASGDSGRGIGGGGLKSFAANAARVRKPAQPARTRPNEAIFGTTRPARIAGTLAGNSHGLSDHVGGRRVHIKTGGWATESKATSEKQINADRKQGPLRVSIAPSGWNRPPDVAGSEPNADLAPYAAAGPSARQQSHAYKVGDNHETRSIDPFDHSTETPEIARASLAQLVREEYRIAWRASFLDRAPFGVTA